MQAIIDNYYSSEEEDEFDMTAYIAEESKVARSTKTRPTGRGTRRNPRRVPPSQSRQQPFVDPLTTALAYIHPGVATDGSAATFLEDPMEIDDPMDVDDSSYMESSFEMDDPMDVDPPAFAISVMVEGKRPYAIWSHAQYHHT